MCVHMHKTSKSKALGIFVRFMCLACQDVNDSAGSKVLWGQVGVGLAKLLTPQWADARTTYTHIFTLSCNRGLNCTLVTSTLTTAHACPLRAQPCPESSVTVLLPVMLASWVEWLVGLHRLRGARADVVCGGGGS